MRDLNEINKILAHQPWLLNKSHIEKLTRGRDDSWSVAEVVHAIVLLAHFHALASLVFSSGINDNEESPIVAKENSNSGAEKMPSTMPDFLPPPPSPPSPPSGLGNAGSDGSVEVLMKKMQSIIEQKLGDEAAAEEDLVKGYERVESQSAEIGLSGTLLGAKSGIADAEPDLLKFVQDVDFAYVDFARRRDAGNLQTFRVQDYSWDDHGFSLVNQLYDNVGSLLDEKFKITYNLTYNT